MVKCYHIAHIFAIMDVIFSYFSQKIEAILAYNLLKTKTFLYIFTKEFFSAVFYSIRKALISFFNPFILSSRTVAV